MLINKYSNNILQLYDVPAGTLATWGLLINRRLKALICLACQAVITPPTVITHMSRQHKGARISVDVTRLTEIVHEENIQLGWPSITPGVVEYEGLPRQTGFRCPACPVMYQNAKHILAHARVEHELHLRGSDLQTGWMQRLSANQVTHHSWFSVSPRSAQLHSPSADYLRSVREDLDTRPPLPAADLDHRHISPWHATTRWLQYTEGKDPRRMQALIEPPKEGEEYFFLIACVRNYVQAAYDLIPQSSEVCLQILHTDTRTE